MATREAIIEAIEESLDEILDPTQATGGTYFGGRLATRIAVLDAEEPPLAPGEYVEQARYALGTAVTEVFEPNDWRTAFVGAIADGILANDSSLDPHAAVRVTTDAPITLSGIQTIDDILLVAGDRVLVKDQAAGEENGVYVVASGAWTRALDMDQTGELVHNTFVAVLEGTDHEGQSWIVTTEGAIILGTTPTEWALYQGSLVLGAGDGLVRIGNEFHVGAGTGITVTADAVQISATYAGQSSIITLGTITTGGWQGSTIAPTFGGTGITTYVLGDMIYSSAPNTLSRLAGNTVAGRRFLRQTGTGSASAAPVWDTIVDADLPAGIVRSTRTISTTGPLTGGGDLSANRTLSIQGLSGVGTANQIPGANAAAGAWEYKTFSGTTNRLTVTHTPGFVTWDISASYAGQASIVTLGTVTTGTWNGSPIGIVYGGTGLSSYATGDILYASSATVLARLAGNTTTTRKFLRQTGNGSVSAAPAWDTLLNADIPTALTGKTYNGLTLTAAASGFTIAGGTTSRTLTVALDASVSGTNTGDQFLSIAGYSVVGRSASSSGAAAAITAGVDAYVLRRSGGSLDFGFIGNASISDVAWAKVTSRPTTLSGYGITDAQPLDADLTAIAALATTGYARRTGTNTWVLDSTVSATTISGLTANRTVITDGAGGLTVNTETGTGNHMRAISPTTTGTLTGAAANFSGAVSTGALSASTGSFTSTVSLAGALHLNGTGDIMRANGAGTKTWRIDGGNLRIWSGDGVGEIIGFNSLTGAVTHAYTLTQIGAATFASNITQTAGVGSYSVNDNTATAWEVRQGSNNYLKISTANGTENIAFGNGSTNPSYTFFGSNSFNVTGPANFSSSATVTGAFSAQGGRVRTTAGGITGANTNRGYLIVGTSGSLQVQIDNDDIQAMNNDTPAPLYLNYSGGNTHINGGNATGALLVGHGDSPIGRLDVRRNSGSEGVIAAFGDSTAVGANRGGYIYFSATNTINFGFQQDTDSGEGWLNYRGYNNGATRFRNLTIGDGRQNRWVWFNGSNKFVTINNGDYNDGVGKLQVNGKVYATSFYTNPDHTGAQYNAEASSSAYFNAKNGTDDIVYMHPSHNYFVRKVAIGGAFIADDLLHIAEPGSNLWVRFARNTGSNEQGLRFTTNGTDDWFFYEDDNATAGHLQIQRAGEPDATPRMRFRSDNSDIEMGLAGGNTKIAAGGGSVRIGDANTPGAKLDVAGNIRFSSGGASGDFGMTTVSGLPSSADVLSGDSLGTNMFLRNYSNTFRLGGRIFLYGGRGSAGSPSSSASGDYAGAIFFATRSGSDDVIGAVIEANLGTVGNLNLRISNGSASYYQIGQRHGFGTNQPASVVDIAGSLSGAFQISGANLNLDHTHMFLRADGAMGYTLPLASTCKGRAYFFHKGFAGGNMAINRSGSDLIQLSGGGTTTFLNYTSSGTQILVSDGVNRWVSYTS